MPSQIPDLKLRENLWHDLNSAVHQHNPSNFMGLKQFCFEEYFPVAKCAKVIDAYPKSLAAVIATKVVSTKVLHFWGLHYYYFFYLITVFVTIKMYCTCKVVGPKSNSRL